MKLATLVAALLVAVTPLTAQTLAQLKKELKDKETAAKSEPAAMVEVAAWAKDKGLVRDSQRILQAVLKIDKDNEAANDMLGFVKWQGEWVTKQKADALRKKAVEDEMKAKGFVNVDEVWVSKEEVADAKKGVFMHEGERVTKTEKMAFNEGKVRHPVTGEFIAPDDLAKANQGLFPVGNGKWVDEAEADKFHSAPNSPWVFRTLYATVLCNQPLAKLKSDIGPDLDAAINDASRVLPGMMPSPVHRPLVLIAGDSDQFKQLGQAIGDEGSAYGVFPAIRDVEVFGVGTVQPIVMNWDANWGPYWLKHAAGLAWIRGIAADLGVDLPLWFQRGIGGMTERFFSTGAAQHFGRQHLEKGGVNSLQSWFNSFAISNDLESKMLDYNIFQAGLMFAFAMEGGDEETTKALGAVGEAIKDGTAKKITAAIDKLQATLIKKQDAVRDHLRKIVTG
ncbi:MAG: hypothetical protein U1F36_18290 [Planctomycetota bacterium]